MTDPILLQRAEGAAIACAAATLFVGLDAAWWWLLVVFLAFDLSALGYLAGPRSGAILYNAGHTYAAPLLVGVAGVLAEERGVQLAALAWGFHIGVDRALGYGLKLPTAFQDTHLGRVGRPDASA